MSLRLAYGEEVPRPRRGLVGPPKAPSRAGTQPRLIDPYVAVVEVWLRADITIKGAVVHERLVVEYGFSGSYQRVKEYLAKERPRLAAELAAGDENPLTGLHGSSNLTGHAGPSW